MIRSKLLFLLMLITCVVGVTSCERDDICPPGTPTTPELIIKFVDVDEPSESKQVIDLSIEADLSYIENDSTVVVMNRSTTDSISVPLNTNTNISRFILTRNTDNENFENTDEIEFTYQVVDEYVNRACSFKALFTDLSATRIAETPLSDNWIRSIIVDQPDVENEQITHVFILH